MRSKLKLAIIESGFTQYELARKLNITESRMSRVVQGRLDPTAAECQALTRILGCQIDDLHGEKL